MKRTFLSLFAASVLLSSCNGDKCGKCESDLNPFFAEYNTPYQTAPFDKIKFEHYKPAFLEGMKQEQAEVLAIANGTEEPTFENTIEAFEKTGEMLSKVSSVFYAVKGFNNNDSIAKLAKELSPLLTKHSADISLNVNLFKRIKTVYDKKDDLKLSIEQNTLLDKMYKGFVRSGANLDAAQKTKLRAIDEKLSMLTMQFGDNVLAETNAFVLVIDKKEDLAGLPESVIGAAAEKATAAGKEGKWMFGLDKPSMLPFLQYANKRELREKLYMGYTNRANNNNAFDNKKLALEIVNLRLQRAKLFGFKNHAAYILDKNMAKTPELALELLNKLWKAALPNAKKEAIELQKMIDKEGGKFQLASWDWWYYSDKVKKAKYALDEE